MQNKAQYNLGGENGKISPLSSENVGKYEFLTSEDVLQEKGILEKAATIKRFKYSPLSNELKKNKKQMDIAKDQYKLFKDQMLLITTEKVISRQKMGARQKKVPRQNMMKQQMWDIFILVMNIKI